MKFAVKFCPDTGRAFMEAMEFDDWREALEFVRTWNAGLPPVKADAPPVVVLQPASESLATAPPEPAALPEQPCTCPNCGKEFSHARARSGHMTWCGKPRAIKPPKPPKPPRIQHPDESRDKRKAEFRRILSDDALGVRSFAAVGTVSEAWIKNRAHGHCWPTEADIETLRAVVAKAHAALPSQTSKATPQVVAETPQASAPAPQASAPAPQVARIQPEAFVPEWLTVFRLVTDQVERGDGPEAVCRRFALAYPWDKLTPGNCAAVLEDFSEDIARLTEARKSSLEQYQLEKLNLQTRLSAQPRIQCSGRRAQGASA